MTKTNQGTIYALLTAVGDYSKVKSVNFPTYRMDQALIGTALTDSLRVPEDQIRMVGDGGFVTSVSMVRALSEYQALMTGEDTFLFYFSGHGLEKKLLFSDRQVELQSIIDYIDAMPAKNKIVILDCCYAGDFKTQGTRALQFEYSLPEQVGKGIAILASSSADALSRLGPDGSHSLFTGALSAAITFLTNRQFSRGQIFLSDIFEETRQLMNAWSLEHPEKAQTPVFRSSMIGMVSFGIGKQESNAVDGSRGLETSEYYKVVKTTPMDTEKYKRLSVFVVLREDASDTDLAAYTKEIAGRMTADAVWCYYGMDESDMINHRHLAYTIWVAKEELKQVYFKPGKHSTETDGIYIWRNASYEMLRKLQEPTADRETLINENRALLSTVISLAEQFVVSMQEVVNGTISAADMRARYDDWIRDVKDQYIRLSDGEMPPDDLHDWIEATMDLTGWILNLALILDQASEDGELGERKMWLIRYTTKRYYQSLEQLSGFDV